MVIVEVVRKGWKHSIESPALFDDVYTFEDGKVMDSKEFSDYYKKHESKKHHIVII